MTSECSGAGLWVGEGCRGGPLAGGQQPGEGAPPAPPPAASARWAVAHLPRPCLGSEPRVAMPCRFVPALRQLRQQAFLLHFPPILSSRLAQRLQEVGDGWGGGM